ncbi:MAG: hypothetical protein HY072_04025 [Deltaproteobacteria bacterium]|nr:hypothetical protein [Deltaproteobacteria bacterium]
MVNSKKFTTKSVFCLALWLWVSSQSLSAGLADCPPQPCHEAWQKDPETLRDQCHKEWTVLVYMAADNNLTPYAYLDLYEMEVGIKKTLRSLHLGSTDLSDILVHLDTAGNEGIRRLHVMQNPNPPLGMDLKIETFRNWDNSKIFSPQIGTTVSEENQTEAQKLEDFLTWATSSYPSRHYMLIVWGHGQGWAPAKNTEPVLEGRFLDPNSHETKEKLFKKLIPNTNSILKLTNKIKKIAQLKKTFSEIKNIIYNSELAQNIAHLSPFKEKRDKFERLGGLAFNYTQKTFLDIPSLRNVLSKIFSKDKPLDIYASDACLMQMIEVATEISDLVRYTIGSAEVQSYVGLPYSQVFDWFNRALNLKIKLQQKDRLNLIPFSSWDYEPYVFSIKIPELMQKSLDDGGSQKDFSTEGGDYLTMSAISNDSLRQSLLPNLDQLGDALFEYLQEDPARKRDLKFVMQQTPRFQNISQEFNAFLTLLELILQSEIEVTETETIAVHKLKLLIPGVKNILANQTVIKTVLGTKYVDSQKDLFLLGFKAFSVWLPVSQAEFKERFEKFKTSRFYSVEVPSWPKWLEEVYRE